MLKNMIKNLDEYNLEWWTPTLHDIVDKIIDTYTEDNVDQDFWKYIFKYYDGCGSGVNDTIDGWVINLIPYINDAPSQFAKRRL